MYKHQKLAIWLNIFPIILKIMTIIVSFLDEKNRNDDEDINICNFIFYCYKQYYPYFHPFYHFFQYFY